MVTLHPAVGAAIRDCRSRRRLSRSMLAQRSGVSLRHLTEIERGANFSMAILVEIMAVMPEMELSGALRAAVAAHRQDSAAEGGVA